MGENWYAIWNAVYEDDTLYELVYERIDLPYDLKYEKLKTFMVDVSMTHDMPAGWMYSGRLVVFVAIVFFVWATAAKTIRIKFEACHPSLLCA